MDNCYFFIFNSDSEQVDEFIDNYLQTTGKDFDGNHFNSKMLEILSKKDPKQKNYSLFSVNSQFKMYIEILNYILPYPKVQIEKYKIDLIKKVLSSQHDINDAINIIEKITFSKYDTEIKRVWKLD